jgi:hypothetical protein
LVIDEAYTKIHGQQNVKIRKQVTTNFLTM